MSLELKERQLQEALEEAKEIKNRTDLNEEERADLVGRVERIEKMREEIAQDKQIRKSLADEQGVTEEEFVQRNRKAYSVGQAYVKSEEYAAAKSASFRGNSPTFQVKPVEADSEKAEPDPITIVGDSSALAGILSPQRLNQILGLPSYPTTFVQRLPSVDIGTASSVTYFLEDSETDTIGFVGEGNEKPNFTLTGAPQEDTVYLVAGMAALTRQTLENAAFMAGFVNTRMQVKLEKVKENAILNGNGSTEPDGFFNRPAPINTDFLTETGSQTDAQNMIDSVYLAMTKGWEEGGLPSDLVVFRPSDWATIVLAKDDNARYYGNGPFAAAVGDSIWGVEVAKSAFEPASHVLVGPFGAGCIVLTRGGQQVRTSDSHADYFKKNKVAVLLEEEIGLAVFTPDAFVDLDLSATS